MQTAKTKANHSLAAMPQSRTFFLPCVILISCLLQPFIPAVSLSQDSKGLEIMQRVYSREVGDTVIGTVEMILVGKDGSQRKRMMKIFTKRYDELTKRIVFFLAPADVTGTALLTYDYTSVGQDDDQWIYLPALHKTKRISAGNRSGSFMGSDFSYGDMTQKSLESYTYQLLKEQQVNQHAVWIIEAVPKNDEIINLYGYSKSLFLVRQDNFVVVRAVHWLKNKNILKYNEVTQLEKRGDIWVPMEVRAKTVDNGNTVHQTLLINTDVKLNTPVDDALFTKRRLKQGL